MVRSTGNGVRSVSVESSHAIIQRNLERVNFTFDKNISPRTKKKYDGFTKGLLDFATTHFQDNILLYVDESGHKLNLGNLDETFFDAYLGGIQIFDSNTKRSGQYKDVSTIRGAISAIKKMYLKEKITLPNGLSEVANLSYTLEADQIINTTSVIKKI